MKNHDIDFAVLGGRIKEILYEYVKIQSFTNTEKEREIENFFENHFNQVTYFREHHEFWGTYPL